MFFIGGVLPDEKLPTHLHDNAQGLNRQRRQFDKALPRARKSGKTLITLTSEKGGVRVLMVLGTEESEKALSIRNELSP